MFEGFGCLRRAGHKNVDSSLKRTNRVGSIVNSRLADTSLLRTAQQYRQSFDQKKSSYWGISLPRTQTHDPEVIATTGVDFFLENILVLCVTAHVKRFLFRDPNKLHDAGQYH